VRQVEPDRRSLMEHDELNEQQLDALLADAPKGSHERLLATLESG
jgi:hypothetical protein